jgi:hypothetical protein
MKNGLFNILPSLVLSTLFSMQANAWSNHGLSTYIAVGKDQKIMAQKNVKVESLQQFLEANKKELAPLIAELNKQLQSKYPFPTQSIDPKLDLSFKSELSGDALKLSFLKSLRISTRSKYANFIQDIPGANLSAFNKMERSKVSIISAIELARKDFLEIKKDDEISPQVALASYVDEPDFGMDTGLFSDSKDSSGKAIEDGQIYGFGAQPFGNPALEYGTQAPFHIHFQFSGAENVVVSIGQPGAKKTYTPMRLQQFSTLSKFAFSKGHSYWGFRFAGWALHYVQDLTQPYHSSLCPGHNPFSLLGAGVSSSAKAQLLNEVTALHTAIEEYQFKVLVHALESNKLDNISPSALKDPSLEGGAIRFDEVPSKVATVSHALSHELAATLRPLIGEQIYLRDAEQNVGVDYYQIIETQRSNNSPLIQKFDLTLEKLSKQLGAQTRDFLKSIVP